MSSSPEKRTGHLQLTSSLLEVVRLTVMASHLDDVVTDLLDAHAPMTEITCRVRRSSDGWYDSECRSAKRRARGQGKGGKLVQNWATSDVFCIRCGRGGHTALLCRLKWSNTHKRLEPEPPTVCIAGTASKFGFRAGCCIYKQFEPFCAPAIQCTKEGARRLVVFLHDSGVWSSPRNYRHV